MLVAEGNNSFRHLYSIEATVFPENLKFASLTHADDGLVVAEASHIASHDDGQLFKALCLGAACLGDEIRRDELGASAAGKLAADAKSLGREFRFVDFYRTMSFVNALAHIANIEDHHPDLEVGYNYCRVKFTTHAVKGLSENDFVCAAKVDQIALG